jgi:hypothetical protein
VGFPPWKSAFIERRWGQVQAVAEALIEKRFLTEREVKAIVRKAR